MGFVHPVSTPRLYFNPAVLTASQTLPPFACRALSEPARGSRCPSAALWEMLPFPVNSSSLVRKPAWEQHTRRLRSLLNPETPQWERATPNRLSVQMNYTCHRLLAWLLTLSGPQRHQRFAQSRNRRYTHLKLLPSHFCPAKTLRTKNRGHGPTALCCLPPVWVIQVLGSPQVTVEVYSLQWEQEALHFSGHYAPGQQEEAAAADAPALWGQGVRLDGAWGTGLGDARKSHPRLLSSSAAASTVQFGLVFQPHDVLFAVSDGFMGIIPFVYGALAGTASWVPLGFGGCCGQKPPAEAAAMPGKDCQPRLAPLPQLLPGNYLSEDYISQTCYPELSEGFIKI